jgi:hypothetical protein
MNAYSTFANPFLVWAQFATKAGEMMFASAQVIAHRTGRLAAAGAHPSVRDRKEFALMGTEKVAAAGESARNMATRIGMANARASGSAWIQMMKMSQDMMNIAMSRTTMQAANRQMALTQRMVNDGVSAGATATRTAGRIASQGLKPIHGRATRNAKRLAKR